MRQTTELASRLGGLGYIAGSLLKRHSAEIPTTQDGGTVYSRSAAHSREHDIPICDWDVLFEAVTARLRQTVMDDPVEPCGRQLVGNANSVRASVLECVAALDQLQRSMKHELMRCQSIELQAFDATTALAQELALQRKSINQVSSASG